MLLQFIMSSIKFKSFFFLKCNLLINVIAFISDVMSVPIFIFVLPHNLFKSTEKINYWCQTKLPNYVYN